MSDSAVSLTDFEVLSEVESGKRQTVCHAIRKSSGRPVRLTVFSPQISRSVEFRKAFKTDRPMQETLRHQSVLKYLGDGESEGRLFFWTDPCEFPTLQHELQAGRVFLTDDLIEIGWQICSALQQAHNTGLSHGGLTSRCILLSENDIQVRVADFGIPRWYRSAENTDAEDNDTRRDAGGEEEIVGTAAASAAASAAPRVVPVDADRTRSERRVSDDSAALGISAWRREVERDLQSLAAVMLQSLNELDIRSEGSAESTSGKTLTASLRRLLERTLSAETLPPAFRARDLQGRFGELLIGGEDDQIHMLDQREHQLSSRRSIVVELFDTPEIASSDDILERKPTVGPNADRTTAQRVMSIFAGKSQLSQFLPVLLIVIAVVVLLILAVQK